MSRIARAKYKFAGKEGRELSFAVGDEILVLKETDKGTRKLPHRRGALFLTRVCLSLARAGWTQGLLGGKKGWFPTDYVDIYDAPTEPAPPPPVDVPPAEAAGGEDEAGGGGEGGDEGESGSGSGIGSSGSQIAAVLAEEKLSHSGGGGGSGVHNTNPLAGTQDVDSSYASAGEHSESEQGRSDATPTVEDPEETSSMDVLSSSPAAAQAPRHNKVGSKLFIKKKSKGVSVLAVPMLIALLLCLWGRGGGCVVGCRAFGVGGRLVDLLGP